MTQCDLNQKNCQPCEGGVDKFTREQAEQYLTQLTDWQLNSDATEIFKRFEFKGFNKTMSFMNAVAWLVNKEMHHPDVKLGYNYCEVHFTTHAIDGLSENDFICAAKVDQLLT